MLLKQKLWTGKPIRCDGAYGFDTETTLIEPGKIPELIVLTFSTNDDQYIVQPSMLSQWVQMVYESGCPIVAHNFSFDFHVVHKALNYIEDIALWKKMVDEGRCWDTMILDFLLRLANGEEDGPLRPRSLADLAEHYMNTKLDKSAQTEWSQYYNVSLEHVPDSMLEYALKDSQVVRELFNELQPTCINIAKKYQVLNEFHGPLTHHTQLKGAIALTDCSRVGIKVDSKAREEVSLDIKLQIQEKVQWLLNNYPNLFKRDVVKKRLGQLMVNEITGVPSIDNRALRVYLKDIAEELKVRNIPKTAKSNEITISTDFWSAYKHPFLQHWMDMQTKAKLLNFVDQIKSGAVNPHYQPLVRTGRTSCSSPNLQQMPKQPWFRKLFVPHQDSLFVVADYNAIELRCLAAICMHRFGYSRLAEAFETGVDPHSFTASMLLGMQYENFIKLKSTDKEKYNNFRFAAKAVNFGVPGGLGAKSLREYAEATYGAHMTLAEAKLWRNMLVTEIYPELSQYLASSATSNLATNLGTNTAMLTDCFGLKDKGIFTFQPVADIVSGNNRTKDGQPYNSAFRRMCWQCLEQLNTDPTLELALRSRKGSDSLRRRLFGSTVITLTGRVRGCAEYTESCNTQFQGLAADGAKLALYNVSQIYPVVAFVHDELVVEIPNDEPELHKDNVVRMMRENMDIVLGGYVKSDVEAIVTEYWGKS